MKESISCRDIVEDLLAAYRREKSPIAVKMRSVFPIPGPNARATHSLHQYPAKMVQNIPALILNSPQFRPSQTGVLDPFCGSGTVLVEAAVNGLKAEGWDVNPFAVELAKSKTKTLNVSDFVSQAGQIAAYAEARPDFRMPDVVNLHYWYSSKSIASLAKLALTIQEWKCPEIVEALNIALSITANKASHRDLAVAVPVRRRQLEPSLDPYIVFRNAVEKVAKHHKNYNAMLPGPPEICVINRSVLNPSPNRKFELILTSPPYLGAQKYIRSCYLSLGWLAQCQSKELRQLEATCIGREHYVRKEYSELLKTGISQADKLIEAVYKENPLRAHIAASYLIEMRLALVNIKASLRPGGHLVMVTADNTLVGRSFGTTQFLQHILESELNMVRRLELIDPIPTRALLTKRKGGSDAVIKHETISVFTNK